MRIHAEVDLSGAVSDVRATCFGDRGLGAWLIVHVGSELMVTGRPEVVVQTLRNALAEVERSIEAGDDLEGCLTEEGM